MSNHSLRILLALLLLLSSLTTIPAVNADDHSYPAVTAPPIAWQTVDDKGTSTYIAAGLFLHREKGSYERNAVQPWIFNLETDADRDFSRMSVAFDLLHVEHQGDDFRRHLFPVYWQGQKGKRNWFHLWPLYGESEESDGSQTVSTLYPLFSLTRHPDSDDRTVRFFWPLGEVDSHGEETSKRFLPLYWQHDAPQVSEGMIFPYFWFDEKESQTRIFAPFYWRHKAPQISEGMIFPYLWSESDESHTDAVLPFWWWKRSPEKNTGYFLLYAWREKGEERQELLFPLWWRFRSPESRFTLLVPFYYGWENRQGSGSVAPLWYSSRQEENEFTTLLPFYIDWRSGEEKRLQLVLPLYGDHRSETSATRVFLPFYFRHDNTTFDSSMRYWFPFFGSYERGSETEKYYLFPLYAHMQDRSRGYNSRFFLWPLIHHETLPDARDTWVLPLFRRQRSNDESHTMGGLLWWSGHAPERDYTLLLPLYGHWRNPGGEYRVTPVSIDIRKPDGYRKRFFLGPLAIATEEPLLQSSQLDILWPLISRRIRGGETVHSRVFPLWWHDQSEGRSFSLALIPPYYFRQDAPDKMVTHVWPFYGRKIDGDFREDAVLWPLFRYGRESEGERRSWQALLAFGSSDTDRSSVAVVPLWYHQRKGVETKNLSLLHWQESSPDTRIFSLLHLGRPDWSLFNVSQSPTESHQHLFPFYSYSRSITPEKVRTWVVWPLYSFKRNEEQRRHALLWWVLYSESGPQKNETGFLWRLIRSRSDAQTTLFELNPGIFYRETRADGSERFTSWLGGIYATRATAAGTEHRFLWFLRW